MVRKPSSAFVSEDSEHVIEVLALIDGISGGGAESQLVEFATAANSVGIRLTVCALHRPSRMHLIQSLQELGVPTYTLSLSDRLPLLGFVRVVRACAKLNPDVIHTHLFWSDLLGGLSARLLGIPQVSTLHQIISPTGLSQRAKHRVLGAVRRKFAAEVITVSSAARKAYLEGGWDRPEHVVVVRGTTRGEPKPGKGELIREQLGIQREQLVVATLSVIRPEKRHDISLSVIEALKDRHPQLRLVIIGGRVPYAPRTFNETQKHAEALGDTVIMLGHRNDVMDILDAVDILIHPSDHEGLSIALLEAAAAGLPVVATRTGGISEVVVDGSTGLLVDPPVQTQPFVNALETLINDPQLRCEFGAAARERFEREFQVEAWAQRLRSRYVHVLKNNGQSGEDFI